MSLEPPSDQPDVATKVMRRVHVSRMTRALQNSLALANVKIKHGWENLSIDTIEPRIDQELKRKRPNSSTDAISDSSSSVSDPFSSVNGLASSPLTLPMFSDDLDRRSSAHGTKRARIGDSARMPASSSHTRGKSRSAATVQSWKRSHRLPESSPAFSTRQSHFMGSIPPVSKLSFISEGSTVADDAPSPDLSEDDDADLPVHSFTVQQTLIHSSPPRTPPPQRRLIDKAANVSWSRTPRTGEEGADLLMYLATSPTPATINMRTPRAHPPSTPPSKATPLPSSMMSTPGGTGLFAFAPNTPSNNFNLSDFCNVTPSPGQSNWPRTPGTAKTPLAASQARRKLNFDSLLPPTSSPNMARGSSRRDAGLGMDFVS